MRIAVNTRFLLPGRLEGIGWFTYNTLKVLTQRYPDVHFTFLFDRPWDEKFVFSTNITPVKLFPPARHPVLWYWYFEHSVHAYLQKHPHDIYLSPDGYLSLRHSSTPQIAVIHDINFEHHPEFVPPLVRRYYRHFFPRFAHKASRIATVSQWSKSDLVSTYGVEAEKIDVVYNGASEIFKPISEKEKQEVRLQVSEGKPYFIFIGAFNPRKNIEGLFRSFDLFCSRHTADFRLVVVGEKMHWTPQMEKTYHAMEHSDKVLFVGRKQGEELNQLLAAAEALWFVSHFEGFGIPVVEAFRAGVPVITSTATSLPEVGGEVALYCNSTDYEQIAQAMHTITSDSGLRQQLITKGMVRAREFTWQKTAERLWNTILAAIES
ncbi:glycosyl transferase [Thermaurantimonas aggregans]|uniref:Glycosyl transferase n=1 Tax=Thermaurantimonas aggregans TaxID=2173829 RepID=A0A401XIX2_9FLAO|nr:glycosyltransferase family 1 protein [Thermaurantimonas aggregans]MCX8149016.1 glycosyltransferase family 4 protein [Thermaurantimonas aggregans]GCD76969.1 glycosyl transferase [Thermaurantimonas aggregans]